MIRALFLINLRATFASMFKRSKNSKKRKLEGGKIGIAVLILYCVVVFGYLFFNIFRSIRDPFFELGIGWLYFALDGLLVFSLCVFTCIFTAQSQIFNAKDNELLLSMPIKPSAILTARILTLLVPEYAFEALISIPALIVWILGGHSSPLGIVFFAIEFLLLPLLALAVACLLAWILALATSRMRRKNILTLVISIAFFAVYFIFCFNMQGYVTRLVESGSEIADAFRRGFPPIFYFGRAVTDGSVADIALFAACAVVPFVLIIALLSANFIKVATTKRGAKRIEYREKALKASSPLAALNKKELAHYWGNPMFVLNMTMGSMFMVVCGGAVIIKRAALLGTLGTLSALLPGLSYAALAGIALSLCATMNCASASLISIEGRSLWIAKSLPVNVKSVLLAKLLMHMQISAIPGIFASLCAAFALFPRDLPGILTVLLMPLLFTLFTGLFGLTLNVLLPKFDWVNEVQPVKQGMPVMILMFGAMALVIVIALLYILLLHRYMSSGTYAWLVIAALAVADALLYRWLVTRGARRFEAFEA
jgi:ABC-2 type transport system permease protein